MTIKVGIIGCGEIARTKHMPGLARLRQAELAAFHNRTRQKAKDARKQFGSRDSKVYSTYQELLDDPAIDAVHVCTSHGTHAEISIAALDKGKHVLCEKPMAVNAEEARRMRDAAERNNRKLSISYQNRFTMESQYLKGLIRAGELGHIYFAKAHAVRRRAVPTWGDFHGKTVQGGGALIDIGSHALDLTLWLMDNYSPRYVVGNTYHELLKKGINANSFGPVPLGGPEVEESCFGFLTMRNGATVFLESSWALNILDGQEAKTTLCGTGAGADLSGGLRINGEHRGQLYTTKPLLSPGEREFGERIECLSPGEEEIAQWIDCLVRDAPPPVTADQALIVQEILEGMYVSAASGKPVHFEAS